MGNARSHEREFFGYSLADDGGVDDETRHHLRPLIFLYFHVYELQLYSHCLKVAAMHQHKGTILGC